MCSHMLRFRSNVLFIFSHLSQVIQERRRQKSEECHTPIKKDLLDLLMGMYDEETDSRMNDEELRSQVYI